METKGNSHVNLQCLSCVPLTHVRIFHRHRWSCLQRVVERSETQRSGGSADTVSSVHRSSGSAGGSERWGRFCEVRNSGCNLRQATQQKQFPIGFEWVRQQSRPRKSLLATSHQIPGNWDQHWLSGWLKSWQSNTVGLDSDCCTRILLSGQMWGQKWIRESEESRYRQAGWSCLCECTSCKLEIYFRLLYVWCDHWCKSLMK